jgi:hypothetical protein
MSIERVSGGARIDVDKLAEAIYNEQITGPGSGHVSRTEARELAERMVSAVRVSF